MKKQLTVREFFKQFPDDETCLNHIFNVRFGNSYACPKCEKDTKWHRIKAERAYSCQYCGHHLHPTVGTPFEKSRTPLQLWFYAIYLFTSTRHGVSAKELERQLGVTYKCAWRMGHEIRKHMADVDGGDFEKFGGHVEVDETYIGGKEPGVIGVPTQDKSKKTAVVGIVERNGDIHTQAIPDVKTKTLLPIVGNIVMKGSTVSSDEKSSYKKLRGMGYKHGYVSHRREQWVKGIHHTNTIEGYWSHLKKSINSTHIHVSRDHLQKYLDEFEYRYNTRENPSSMFPELISTYQEPSE